MSGGHFEYQQHRINDIIESIEAQIDKSGREKTKEELEKLNVIHKCYVLDIPDMYEFNNPELLEICKEQYNNKTLIEKT